MLSPGAQRQKKASNTDNKKGKNNMECNKERNLKNCNCTYEPCPRKGICCDCITYHKKLDELPTCFFDDSAEKTYDRSIGHFVRLNR